MLPKFVLYVDVKHTLASFQNWSASEAKIMSNFSLFDPPPQAGKSWERVGELSE